MAIAYRAGVTATSGGSSVTTLGITIPATVAAGDVVLVTATCVPTSGPTVATISATSTATTPGMLGSQQGAADGASAAMSAALWTFIAASGDAGATVTIHTTIAGFMVAALEAYSGASGAPDASAVVLSPVGASGMPLVTPTVTTGIAGDWSVCLAAGVPEDAGGTVSTPAGMTARHSFLEFTGLYAGICDSNGPVGAAGTSIGGGSFSVTGGGQALTLWAAWTVALMPAGSLAVRAGSTSGGITSYTVSYGGNGNNSQVTRVLPPTSPSATYPHAFLWCLPVEPGQGSTFGDPLATVQALGAHNAYNLTCIQPGFPVNPWYADNPNDPSTLQESFLLAMTSWAHASLAVTGTERHYLIGFSKSGIGGQALQLRNPTVFAATASWDAPAMMTDYDGTDPTFGSMVGGGSSAVYGTSANFKNNYQVSSAANLASWKNAANFGSVRRLWIGGFNTFSADMAAYDSLLTAQGLLHAYASVSASSHNWAPSPGWVAPALASIILVTSGSGLLMASGII